MNHTRRAAESPRANALQAMITAACLHRSGDRAGAAHWVKARRAQAGRRP